MGSFSVIWSYWNCCSYSISCHITKQRCFLCQKVPLCCKLTRGLCVTHSPPFCLVWQTGMKVNSGALLTWNDNSIKNCSGTLQMRGRGKKWPVIIYVYFLECLFSPIQTSLGVSPGSVVEKSFFSITERHFHSRENTAFIWGKIDFVHKYSHQWSIELGLQAESRKLSVPKSLFLSCGYLFRLHFAKLRLVQSLWHHFFLAEPSSNPWEEHEQRLFLC